MPSAWRHWYHLTLTCYSQWLRGDPRGWRERHHRLHVEGDYKHPPKKTPYNDALFNQSKRLLKFDPFEFTPDQRRLACIHLLESLEIQRREVRSIAVGAKHTHLLIQCPNDDPKTVAGKLKNNVWMRMIAPENTQPEIERRPIWAKGSQTKPISCKSHFFRAFWYDLQHRKEGAWIWCYLERRDCSVPCRHEKEPRATSARGM